MSDAHFYLHHHPSQEALVARLISKITEESEGDVFYAPQVLVRNQGMATWIKQKMASSESQISMQIDFPQPGAFLNGVIAQNAVGKEELLWKIYETLPLVQEQSAFQVLREYLTDNDGTADKLKQYQLATKLAELFDKYLLYRPDLIQLWNEGRAAPVKDNNAHENWQRELWKAIDGPELFHWALAIDKAFMGMDSKKLPKAVHVFGVSTFAPAYLKFLYTISRIIPVHIYWLNPVDGDWSDSPNKRRWILENSFSESVGLFTHNPLLACFGQMGREFVHNIYGGNDEGEFGVQEQDFLDEAPHEPTSVLEHLQKHLRLNKHDDTSSRDSDGSICIHACHSALREVQTLKDYLLDLGTKGELELGEVLVMCTDIAAYSPAIEAVFGAHNQDSEKPLPYRIADRNSPMNHPNIAVIPELLSLRTSRFTNQEAFRLLDTPAILERFKLTKDDLPTITNWIVRNGIRWGFDQEHLNQNIGTEVEGHWSWEDGLERMLLGLTMPSDGTRELWNGMVPYTELEGRDTQILASLCDFVKWCRGIYDDLAHERTLEEWIDKTRLWLGSGFSDGEESQKQLRSVYSALENLSETCAYVSSPLPASVYSEHLGGLLNEEGSPRGFLSGNITFCEMTPMRTIPRETICILGMSHDKFPRGGHELQFDLTRGLGRRAGDRSARNDDLCLFLETLVSVKKNLFISYVGLSIKDGEVLPPSTSLQTLIDYTPGLEVQYERLHAFDPSYFHVDSPQSFDPVLRAAAAELSKDKARPESPQFQSDHVPHEASVDHIISTLTNPCRHFLKNVLQVQLNYSDASLDENEPLSINGLERWQLRNALLHSEDETQMQRIRMQQTSSLPPAQIGQGIYEEQYKALKTLKEALPNSESLDVSVEVEGVSINGRVPLSSESGNVYLASIKNAPRSLLQLRIWQLLASAIREEPVEAEFYFLENNKVSILKLERDENYTENLKELVSLFKQAYLRPLAHFPKSAEAYWGLKVNAKWDEETLLSNRRAKALSIWNSGYNKIGEREDASIECLFPVDDPVSDDFITISKTIWEPIMNLQTTTSS